MYNETMMNHSILTNDTSSLIHSVTLYVISRVCYGFPFEFTIQLV